ncbi:MAG: hypothetical protein OJJ55_19085 [Rhodococcus sp.]|nr:hypothetical protein [Rhodococcus sp. (in: high G+C Gram-positive bacteria)]
MSDPNRPKWTPGALDEQGIRSKADLDFNYKTGQSGTQQNYDDTMGEINSQRPLLDRQRDEGYRGADNSAAARGMYRGGNRLLKRTEVATDWTQANNSLNLAAQRAANARQQAADQLEGQYRTGLTNLTVDSNQRSRDTYYEQNPQNGVSVPAAAPPKKAPTVDYKTWLKGRASSTALAKQWDAEANYKQRFG